MKKLSLFTLIGLCVVGLSYWLLNKTDVAEKENDRYSEEANEKRSHQGAAEYFNMLRANQKTGIVDPHDVLKARQQAEMQAITKTTAPDIVWEEMGPDNVGGRTRGLIVHKDDSNILYTGGVSGGIWRSLDAGETWHQVNSDALDAMPVSTIAQDVSGDIYVGTGEGFYFPGGLGTAGYLGNGIYKYQPGFDMFTQLLSTKPVDDNDVFSEWTDVRRVAAHATIDDKIYAVLGNGAKMSSDGGQTWTNIAGVTGEGYDVRAGGDGHVHIITANNYYRSDVFGENFEKITSFGGSRKALAVSSSDPNYVYVISVKTNACLNEIQRSTDAGATWSKIGAGTSSFEPMGNSEQCQGDYDLAIGVDSGNPDRIFIGGVTLWSWSLQKGWKQIDNLDEDPGNARYVHADKHEIVFDPTNPEVVYICSDGGISKSTNAGKEFPDFDNINKNYNVTQFYSVAAGHSGEVMGGAQDNGTRLINFTLNSMRASIEVNGGDGGYAEISNIKPNVMFAAFVGSGENGGQSGGYLLRSGNGGEGFARFFDDNIDCLPNGSSGGCSGNGNMDNNGLFVTPFYLWEDAELYYKIINTDVTFGGQLNLPVSIYENNINYIITDDQSLSQSPDDIDIYTASPQYIYYDVNTGKIVDKKIERAKFYTGDRAGIVWVTEDALDLTTTRWKQVGQMSGNADVNVITTNRDGTTVWAGSTSGTLMRVSNTNSDSPVVKQIPSTQLMPGQVITGISVDPDNNNRVAITAGNYGNDTYVMISENATSLNPTFTSIQANLPKMPIYDVMISDGDDAGQANYILAATEMGVWLYDPVFGTWSMQSPEGLMGPVLRVRQENMARNREATLSSCKVTYIGTHGRGIFRSTTLTNASCTFYDDVVSLPDVFPVNTGIDDVLNIENALMVYPNPISDVATVEMNVLKNTSATLQIFDIQGRLIKTVYNGTLNAGKNNYELNVRDIPAGNYYAVLQTEKQKVSKKIVVIK
ncbi:MAG: T9SS type A sorting domain-containing protein [Chitinophagales bacterium]|nr:T9SS type A sorting domain-containing protein [Bacteroidota bacterium]